MEIQVDISQQILSLVERDQELRRYVVSTAACGVGGLKDSQKTPSGQHIVRAKIGHHRAIGTVFVGRRPTGEIYHPYLRECEPERDWILTRILWLSGLEVGQNRLGGVDTMQRYVYIHGAPDDLVTGVPSSHGCIRMRNHDIIELFDLAPVGCPVLIGSV